jgi:arginyl-tRNA synthetase
MSMNVYQHVESRIAAALEALKADGALPADIAIPAFDVEAPRDAAHGDLATNAAMMLAKPARMKPRDIADLLKARLEGDPDIVGAEVAGPGFLNLRLDPGVWGRVVVAIIAGGREYGRGGLGRGETVNIEYVSANPTGPMHVGHCRGAVFGDALGNLLDFAGYKVTREYYINDAGAQVDKLGRSAILRYREALGEAIGEIPEGLYPGEYLKPVGAALARTHGKALLEKSPDEQMAIGRDTAIAMLMEEVKSDLAALNIRHDIFFSERSLSTGGRDQVKAAIDDLARRGLIFEGRLEKPKDHDDGEWEDREQTLFRATRFGDDTDRALKKSDGSYTYFAGDVAYHFDKIERGYDHYIDVLGADHIGYIPRLVAAFAALAGGEADLKERRTRGGKADLAVLVCQLVKVMRAGEIVRMSKRAGTFVALRDVVDEVGRDPVRFMMLYRKNDAPLDFDLAKVVEQSKDNPIFYVQYAHARAASVFRNACEVFPDLGRDSASVRGASLAVLDDAGEVALIKQLAFFPKLTAGAAAAREPHRIAFYLYDLASNFHGQWTRGNDSPHLRFIQPNSRETTAARLALVAATQQVISSGLSILGVEAPEVMR